MAYPRNIWLPAALGAALIACSSADQLDTTVTSAQQNVVGPCNGRAFEVVPQDVQMISWIDRAGLVPQAACDASITFPLLGEFRPPLDENAATGVAGMVHGFCQSANCAEPTPDALSNADSPTFREHRGTMTMKTLRLACSPEGKVLNLPKVISGFSPGFTPIRLDWSLTCPNAVYDEAEQGPSFLPSAAAVVGAGDCAEYEAWTRSRLGALGQAAAGQFGLNVPWVWRFTKVRTCCNGSQTITADASEQPSHAVWTKPGRQVGGWGRALRFPQKNQWVNFMLYTPSAQDARAWGTQTAAVKGEILCPSVSPGATTPAAQLDR